MHYFKCVCVDILQYLIYRKLKSTSSRVFIPYILYASQVRPNQYLIVKKRWHDNMAYSKLLFTLSLHGHYEDS